MDVDLNETWRLTTRAGTPFLMHKPTGKTFAPGDKLLGIAPPEFSPPRAADLLTMYPSLSANLSPGGRDLVRKFLEAAAAVDVPDLRT